MRWRGKRTVDETQGSLGYLLQCRLCYPHQLCVLGQVTCPGTQFLHKWNERVGLIGLGDPFRCWCFMNSSQGLRILINTHNMYTHTHTHTHTHTTSTAPVWLLCGSINPCVIVSQQITLLILFSAFLWEEQVPCLHSRDSEPGTLPATKLLCNKYHVYWGSRNTQMYDRNVKN